MRGLALLMIAGATLNCGGNRVDVRIVSSERAGLDPYVDTGAVKLRIQIDGPAERDEAYLDVAADEARADRGAVYSFEDYPSAVDARVRVMAFDALGNVVAFGEKGGLEVEGRTNVDVLLRRNLAYLTHRPNARFDHPERAIYVIDVGTRVFVESLDIPGVGPAARGIGAWGGRAMLVLYQDEGRGYLGLLSADDHSWSAIELPRPQDLVVAVAESPVGVVAGNNLVTFVDLEAGTVLDSISVGGTPVDGVLSRDGRRAAFVMEQVTVGGLIVVDVERRSITNQDIVSGPSGIALDETGRVAYVTSSVERAVVAFDLVSSRTTRFLPGLPTATRGGAAYSDEMQAVFAPDATGRNLMSLAVDFCAASEVGSGRQCGGNLVSSLPMLPRPVGVVSDGNGRRLVIAGSGTSTTAQDSGITFVETFPALVDDSNGDLKVTVAPPESSRSLYPLDPEDTFLDGSVVSRWRYQPDAVGIIYGR